MIPLVAHLVDQETGSEERFAFLRSPVRIGRAELNDLVMPRSFVSSYHGQLCFDDAGADYVDLGSTNGTQLNGERVQPDTQYPLAAGDVLTIGSCRLTFERVTGEEKVVERPTMFSTRVSTLAGEVLAKPELVEAPVAPPPPPAPLSPAAEEALDAAALDLDLNYASYRGAWEHLRSHVEQVLASLPADARAGARRRLLERYAGLGHEPDFAGEAERERARAPAAVPRATAPVPSPASGAGLASHTLLRTFAETYLPGGAALAGGPEVEALLARVAGVLETFSRSFLELRCGYEEFGREMGVRAVHVEGPLFRARDPAQVLQYLLDPAGEGREAELQRVFADFMIHQVALLRGVVEGARALLQQLSPEAVSATAPAAKLNRAGTLWHAFEERFHDLADEEDAVSAVLFGREFARAYAALVGHAPESTGSGEQEDRSFDRAAPVR